MLLLLVRHGHAGSRATWVGDDRWRPLSAQGWAQARAVSRVLGELEPRRILSSPYLRCTQTVAPLSASSGLQVERSEALVPRLDGQAIPLLHDLGATKGPVVLCTHGEVIEAVQRAVDFPGSGPDAGRKEKGSIWVLRYAEGAVTRACYLPPLPGPKAPSRDLHPGA